MKSFKRWCEDNGRRHTGTKDFNEFKRNAEDYEKYRKDHGGTNGT